MIAAGVASAGLVVGSSPQARAETDMERDEWMHYEFETHPQSRKISGFGWSASSFDTAVAGQSVILQAVKGANRGVVIKLFRAGNEKPTIEAYPSGRILWVCEKDTSDIPLLVGAFRAVFDQAPLVVPQKCFRVSRVPGP